MTSEALTTALIRGLRQLGEDPAAHPCDRYIEYIGELIRWNRAYNLTAARDPERILSHHVLDSLSVLPYLHGERCLDVGSGAGLPGFILALARSDTRWTLLDSKIKKARFLRHVKQTLGADNVEIVQGRVESFMPDQPYDTVIARAFTSLGELCRITARLRAPGGVLLAMKGDPEPAELEEIPAESREVIDLKVPGVDAPRRLVRVRGDCR